MTTKITYIEKRITDKTHGLTSPLEVHWMKGGMFIPGTPDQYWHAVNHDVNQNNTKIAPMWSFDPLEIVARFPSKHASS